MNIQFTTKLAAAVMAVCASTVSFAEVTRAETVEFTYSPTELNSDEGAAELDKRIRKFARQNCRTSSPIRTLSSIRECREDIEAQLYAAIGTSAE